MIKNFYVKSDFLKSTLFLELDVIREEGNKMLIKAIKCFKELEFDENRKCYIIANEFKEMPIKWSS